MRQPRGSLFAARIVVKKREPVPARGQGRDESGQIAFDAAAARRRLVGDQDAHRRHPQAHALDGPHVGPAVEPFGPEVLPFELLFDLRL